MGQKGERAAEAVLVQGGEPAAHGPHTLTGSKEWENSAKGKSSEGEKGVLCERE